jgi:hypothetical protein
LKKVWTFNPHAGGRPIPPAVQERTRNRILAHAQAHYSDRYERLGITFKGKFCYIDAFEEPGTPSKKELAITGETLEEYRERLRAIPTHLCRLRYFDEDKWSVAFYTYSNEKYEPSVFNTGEFLGTPEQGLDVGAVYLQ